MLPFLPGVVSVELCRIRPGLLGWLPLLVVASLCGRRQGQGGEYEEITGCALRTPFFYQNTMFSMVSATTRNNTVMMPPARMKSATR